MLAVDPTLAVARKEGIEFSGDDTSILELARPLDMVSSCERLSHSGEDLYAVNMFVGAKIGATE
jgi:hypothetical protein